MNNHAQLNCPSIEELSEYFDGFSPREAAIESHLDSCEKCRQTIEAMKKINKLISEDTRAPESLPHKIIDACIADAERRSADKEVEALFVQQRHTSLWRYAALFIATAVITSLVTMRVVTNEPTAADNMTVARLVDAHVAELDANYGYSFADSLKEHRIGAQSANNNLEEISVNGAVAHNHQNTADRKLTLLPDVVSHVWHSEDATAAADYLTHFKDIKFTELGEDDKNSIRTFTCTATDSDLQKITDTLYKQPGWSLLSPALPQPNEENKIFFRNRPVKYIITLVSDDK